MLQFFAMRIKISAIYLKFFFITAKQYCLPISSSIRLTAVPPLGNNTNTETKSEFVFFFFYGYIGIVKKRGYMPVIDL